MLECIVISLILHSLSPSVNIRLPPLFYAEKKDELNTNVYSDEFRAILDRINGEDLSYETSQVLGKRRRLSLYQVKELERSFEEENRLEPERKVKLAEELELQPRQVAIWFQNRRTGLKTKQLQRDFSLLKDSYDALKLDCNNLEQEKEALTSTVYMHIKEVHFDC